MLGTHKPQAKRFAPCITWTPQEQQSTLATRSRLSQTLSSAMTGGLLRGRVLHPLVESTHILKNTKTNTQLLLEEASASRPTLMSQLSRIPGVCSNSAPAALPPGGRGVGGGPTALAPALGVSKSASSILSCTASLQRNTRAGTAGQALPKKLFPVGSGHARHAVTVRGLPGEVRYRLGSPPEAVDPAAIFLPHRPPALCSPRAPGGPRAPATREPRSVSDG